MIILDSDIVNAVIFELGPNDANPLELVEYRDISVYALRGHMRNLEQNYVDGTQIWAETEDGTHIGTEV